MSGGRGNMGQVPKLGVPVHRTDNRIKAMLKRCLQHGRKLKGPYLEIRPTVFDEMGFVGMRGPRVFQQSQFYQKRFGIAQDMALFS